MIKAGIPLILNKFKKIVRRHTSIDTTVSVDTFVRTYLYVCIYFNNYKYESNLIVQVRPETCKIYQGYELPFL